MAGIRRHPPGFGAKGAPPPGPPGTIRWRMAWYPRNVPLDSLPHPRGMNDYGIVAGTTLNQLPTTLGAVTNGTGWTANMEAVVMDGGSSATGTNNDARRRQHTYERVNTLTSNNIYVRMQLNDFLTPAGPNWIRFAMLGGRLDDAARAIGCEIYPSVTDAANRTNVLHTCPPVDFGPDEKVDAHGNLYATYDDWVAQSELGGQVAEFQIPAGGECVIRWYAPGVSATFIACQYWAIDELVDP